MEVKKGYKQTDVGVIPDEWNIKQLGDCIIRNPDYGINAPAVPYNDNLPTYLRITDISDSGEFIKENKVSVNHRLSTLYFLALGDVVFARTGASVGKTYQYKKEDGELVFAGFLIRVKTDKKILLPELLKYNTQTKRYWNWVLSNSMRSGQPGLNSYEYKSFTVPLAPTIEEQTEIVTVLSDADALISSLEKLIAKKRNIKQGAMQQLLQPKEGWEVKKLGDVSEIYRGGSPRPIEAFLTTNPNGINWIKIGDIGKGAKYIESTAEKIISDGVSRSRYVNQGDFLLSNSMSFGRPYILKTDGCIHDGWLSIQNYQAHFDREFLYYLLGSQSILVQYKAMASGSSVLNLNKEIVKNVLVRFPTIDEQVRIATILADMDNEIAELEDKLEKYKQIKQGMMQQLLTGKIRLI